MGRRRLAYTVRKFNDGFYVLLTIAAEGSLITEIERRLRVSEPVIKFITVRMDEEEKRLAKIKAHRDTHVKRSAIPAAQPARVASIDAATETRQKRRSHPRSPRGHAGDQRATRGRRHRSRCPAGSSGRNPRLSLSAHSGANQRVARITTSHPRFSLPRQTTGDSPASLERGPGPHHTSKGIHHG